MMTSMVELGYILTKALYRKIEIQDNILNENKIAYLMGDYNINYHLLNPDTCYNLRDTVHE